MEIREFKHYEDVKSQWLELNASYKTNELCVDYDLHLHLWNRYRRNRDDQLRILVGSEKGEVIAVLPFILTRMTPAAAPGWIYAEEQLIAREYFSLPDRIHLMVNAFPENEATDLSCFYVPRHTDDFSTAPGRVIDLLESDEAYLASLSGKHRKLIRRNCAINADIVCRSAREIHLDALRPLIQQYRSYWREKKAGLPATEVIDSMEKLDMDLDILRRAQELGKLIALYMYLGSELVAVNFSVRRESDRVDDYLTLRNTGPEFAARGLGNFCIWQNIQVCRDLGIRYYDLSDFPAEYKNRFVNTNRFYYYYSGGIQADKCRESS